MERPVVKITPAMFARALAEAKARAPHTTRRHDYHDGSYRARVDKFLVGCLGEEVFMQWLQQEEISFVREIRGPETPDRADMWIYPGKSVNVKTESPDRRQFFGMLLVTVEEIELRPCEFYVAVKLDRTEGTYTNGEILGWTDLERVKKASIATGFQRSFAIPQEELSKISGLGLCAELKAALE